MGSFAGEVLGPGAQVGGLGQGGGGGQPEGGEDGGEVVVELGQLGGDELRVIGGRCDRRGVGGERAPDREPDAAEECAGGKGEPTDDGCAGGEAGAAREQQDRAQDQEGGDEEGRDRWGGRRGSGLLGGGEPAGGGLPLSHQADQDGRVLDGLLGPVQRVARRGLEGGVGGGELGPGVGQFGGGAAVEVGEVGALLLGAGNVRGGGPQLDGGFGPLGPLGQPGFVALGTELGERGGEVPGEVLGAGVLLGSGGQALALDGGGGDQVGDGGAVGEGRADRRDGVELLGGGGQGLGRVPADVRKVLGSGDGAVQADAGIGGDGGDGTELVELRPGLGGFRPGRPEIGDGGEQRPLRLDGLALGADLGAVPLQYADAVGEGG